MGYLEKKLQAIISAQGWKFKTGNLYDLTSNTSWAEGTPLVQYSTGTGSTLGATATSPYLTFDNDTATKSTSTIVDRLWGQMKWTKPRRLSKVTSYVYQNNNSSGKKTRKLYGIKADNSTVLLGTKENAIGSGDQTLNETWTIADTDAIYYGLALDIYEVGYPGRVIYLYELQVTEWYEKG